MCKTFSPNDVLWMDIDTLPTMSKAGKPINPSYRKGMETAVRQNQAAMALVKEFNSANSDQIEIGKKLVRMIKLTYHKSTKKSHSKLDGGVSLSTAMTINPFCLARREKAIRENDTECICFHCFSAEDMKQFNFLHQAMMRNFFILSRCLIPEESWKTLKIKKDVLFQRIESFGDAYNVTQVRNYTRFTRTHAERRTAAWTKNKSVWKAGLKLEGGKPKTLSLVESSLKIGRPDELSEEDLEVFDHQFTVVRETEDSPKVNCGGRLCKACLRCYIRKGEEGHEFSVTEALKQAVKSVDNR